MERHQKHLSTRAYGRLAIELSIDFIIMYLVMYTMIATIGHFFLNLNNAYMTLMMVTPMSVVMLVSMRSMFPSSRLNVAIVIVGVITFLASFYAMRTQAAIDDRQFLRSMIPHHSGAILMCEQASLKDPEIIALCQEIVRSQNDEISRMQAMLNRL
ncbi:DUF305 domain-containing protein [Pseudorhodoplanes sinuspersici]|uniref:DUF305 domain-containing protein n=1 Tax=Pseudorhodoplanes sinuspersici TaxID=1235591 RepID=A0A1W6ZMS9_9HYPH|nr:DUF305 domain-containing protein [Pseudorhodoplanes sinuspersici]ARP98084.1 DUF305 domain-containing protein [Pseudorhodoplanes sinuspersici]RKE68163.1 DUF305 family protein family protein [Pseudorhodoplanes sinuspersici]